MKLVASDGKHYEVAENSGSSTFGKGTISIVPLSC